MHAKQQKDQLPNLEADSPIGYSLITEKEDVIAKSFSVLLNLFQLRVITAKWLMY